MIIDNDCQHPPDARIASVTLAGGLHRIRVPFFQGPRDCLALVLAVAGPEGDWRVFNTEEFKPPANPENWKFSGRDATAVPPYPEPTLAKKAARPAKPPKKNRPAQNEWWRYARGSDQGCIAYPTRVCGATPMPHLREDPPPAP